MEWLLIFGVIALVVVVAAVLVARRPSPAERELARRREALDIRDLTPEAKASFAARWRDIQLAFVEDPAESVAAAETLVDEVVRQRGYPADDEDERLDLLSVDHPGAIESYRTAVAIRRNDRQTTDVDLLRVAFQNYRSLFEEVTR